MKVDIKIDGDLEKLMAAEFREGQRAVTAAMRATGQALKENWRSQIAAAGLGLRLANSVRSAVFPKGQPSMNAAVLVYSKAPKVVAAHESGALIRSHNGIWLAIPTTAAGHGQSGRKITPGEWQFKTGIVLRFIYTGRGSAFLVADNARTRRGSGRVVKDRRRNASRATSMIPIFILVRQTRLPKRLNLMAAAETVSAQAAGVIIANWRNTR